MTSQKANTISASDFKAQCSRVIDDVAEGRGPFVITKRGRPVAKLVPADDVKKMPVFGFAKGFITIRGDIVEPIDVEWESAR
ncbi:MAG: type II toxin-antitoxin system Phd/YefM family antitoxin [Acidobacteria bacterium]|nr:MAG: type II toxin-antitoxin system Phd/YefM family antitoxin [Acidobacteriota bacterium]